MSNRAARGVTLVELLTVLCLLGIGASLMGPALGKAVAQSRIRSGLNLFASDVAAARMTAMRSGTRVRLEFIESADCPSPRDRVRGSGGYRVIRLSTPPAVVRTVRLSDLAPGLCLESNNDGDMVFNSRGMPVPFENRTVWASSRHLRDSLTISVLGRIRRRY
jgi:prepilin-type N-terminal cleavage/methylation domain-containing protein